MKECIVGKNIKSVQVFVILINLISLAILFVNFPFFLAIPAYGIVSLVLYQYIKLYSVSLNGDYFIFENLFKKVKIEKSQYIGLKNRLKEMQIVGIQFKENREYRFQLSSKSKYQKFFNSKEKTELEIISDKIQAFLNEPPSLSVVDKK